MGKRIHFMASEKIVEALKMVMVYDELSMAEVIRRAVMNHLYLKRQQVHGKRIMVYDPRTGQYSVADIT